MYMTLQYRCDTGMARTSTYTTFTQNPQTSSCYHPVSPIANTPGITVSPPPQHLHRHAPTFPFSHLSPRNTYWKKFQDNDPTTPA